MVVLLIGFLPLTAAVSNLPTGRQSWQKAITWLAAFVLYKPVAATIYALSFKMADHSQGIVSEISGIALMVAAVFALPALMRFVAPITAAASGGNAGALAGAMVGAALATGAMFATGGASAGATGFAGRSAGSKGPSGARQVAESVRQTGNNSQNTAQEAIG